MGRSVGGSIGERQELGPALALWDRYGRCRCGSRVGLGWNQSFLTLGPLFDYSGDGSGTWHSNLAHAVLALAAVHWAFCSGSS